MKLKLFQKQDLARAALHDGLILSWDTGLGKSMAGYLWPLLKVGHQTIRNEPGAPASGTAPLVPARGTHRLAPCKPVLIVAPGDLHQQTALEGVEKFNIETIPLDSQDTFMRLIPRGVSGTLRGLPPSFYITSYTQLTTNGVQRIPDPMDCDDPVALLQTLALKNGEPLPIVPEENEWHQRPDFDATCEFFPWRGI